MHRVYLFDLIHRPPSPVRFRVYLSDGVTCCHVPLLQPSGGAMSFSYQDGCLVRDRLAALSGDADALERLLTALYIPVRKVTRRVLSTEDRDSDLPDDLTQDALLKILTHLSDCRAQSDLELLSWALTIARNTVRSEVRLRTRSMHIPIEYMTAAAEARLFETRSVPVPPSPAFQRLLKIFLEAVDELPPSPRLVLSLRACDERQWLDIAAELRTTPGGARRRYHRARDSLRKRVLEKLGDLPIRTQRLVSRFLRSPPL